MKIEEIIKKEAQSRILFIHEDLLELLNFAYDFKLNNLVPNEQIVLFENDTEAIDDFKASTLIFFLNPVTTAIKTINSIILRNEARAINKRYIVYFVPKVDNFCLDEIARAGLTNKLEVKSFSFGLIAMNPGLVSMQLSPYTHPVEVINLSAEALLRISKLSGKFSKIIGKGDKAKAILQQYERQVLEDDSIVENDNSCLIVLQRKLDPVTPLLTGHSYQALLDHFFGIHHNKIMVPTRLLGNVGEQPEQYLLHNERDPVYEEVAYLCIEEARDEIERRSAAMKLDFDLKRMNLKHDDEEGEIQVNRLRVLYEQIQNHREIIQEIINRMNQLHCYNLIRIQANLLEEGKTDLEEFHYLTLEYPPELILRLICLYSQVYLNANFYTRFQKEILEIMACNYSPTHITSLYLLQKAGFLKNSKLRNKWEQLRLNLDLVPDEPHSYTQVHITYSALSVRFIELVLKQKLTPELSAMLGKDNFIRIEREKEIKEVFVFFVGGVTYGEISCLRLLEKELKIKINILTTNVGNGKEMIKKIIHNPDI